MSRQIALFLLGCTFLPMTRAAAAEGQGPHGPVPTVRATRTDAPVVINGRLDEEVWLKAEPATQFTQRDPDEGQPATEQTELRIAYDDDAVYVGVRLHDREAARIVRRLSRRDAEPDADWFRIYLDPHHDHLTGVQFQVSAAGVQSDAIIYNDSWGDESWDGVWESAVARDDRGWSLEMRIPFSQLRFPAAEHHTWGINAARFIQRRNEQVWLERVPKKESGLASRMAHLTGIDNISPKRRLELLPYTVSRAEFIAPGVANNPFNDGGRVVGGLGLDVKYGLNSNLTLDGTINPDFGQVEVDPAVVNLTAFETFFEEKRPFFIEGSQLFSNFGRSGANNFWGFNRSEPMIFYSRRIGRAPQGSAEGEFVQPPDATTILGAAKMTGKTANGWSIGLLEAVTGRESAKLSNAGVRGRTEVEPLTNYFVGRVQREVGRRAAFGVLTTAVARDLGVPALRSLLPSQAYVAGVDGHYFFDAKRVWVVAGRIAASRISGSESAIDRAQRAPQRYLQRPDKADAALDPAATALGGWTGSVNLNKNSGINQVNAALWAVSPGFESNDLGFNFNADRAGSHVVYQRRNPNPTRLTRSRSFSLAKWWTWNYDRELQGDGVHMFGNTVFKNYWAVFGGAFGGRRVLDDRLTRGGPAMVRGADLGGFFGVETDSRKRVSLEGFVETRRNEFGNSAVSMNPSLRIKPSPSLEVRIGPSLERSTSLAQYVTTIVDPAAVHTFGSRYVFASLDQTELSFQTRVNMIISPKMSLQIFMQPLISVGDYTGFKELARPRTFDFVRYGAYGAVVEDGGRIAQDQGNGEYTVEPAGGAPFRVSNPDFNFKSLRVNAIYRWEFRPGSALYLVWTENRQDLAYPGDFGFRRDAGALFGANPDDVLMVKFTYWFTRQNRRGWGLGTGG